MTPATAANPSAMYRTDELEVTIDASPDRVWEAITKEMHAWWRPDFYATTNPKAFVFEPRVGGRMYEDTGDGTGLLWYTVICIEPKKSLDLAGYIAKRFGGPSQSLLYLRLEAEGNGTVVRISDSRFGYISPDCDVRDGWRLLFAEGLKPYIEKK